MNLRALARQHNQGLTDKEAYRKARAELIDAALHDSGGDDTTGMEQVAATTAPNTGDAAKGEPAPDTTSAEAHASGPSVRTENKGTAAESAPERQALPARGEEARPVRSHWLVGGAVIIGLVLIALWFVLSRG